ncbi:MAG: hypothetical protein M3021_04425 [Actinomycetota bacterium]|nr:hypothetical protein [Actinomycetota bacterium]
MFKKTLATATLLTVLAVTGCSAANNTPAANTSAPSQAAGTTASNDPQDIAPGKYPNKITNSSTTPGLDIVSAIVENNVAPGTNTPVSDHIELQIKNTGTTDMTGFQMFYTVTDTVTGATESYFKDLTGYTLAKGATATLNFDNSTGPGHFGLNTNGIYYKSTNKLDFHIELSATNHKPATIDVSKAAGGAEKKD